MFIEKIIRLTILKQNIFIFFLIAAVFLCLDPASYAASADIASKHFTKGESRYPELYKPVTRDARQNWINCADDFKKAYDAEPDGDYAAVSLYYYGKVYRDLYRFSGNSDDLEVSRQTFKKVVSSFPSSTYSHKAVNELQDMPEKSKNPEKQTDIPADVSKNEVKKKQQEEKADGDMNNVSQKKPASEKLLNKAVAKNKRPVPETEKKAGNSNITGLRFWTENGYTRIVIDTDSKVSYKYSVKPAKAEENEYLVLKFQGCRISDKTRRKIIINSKIVKTADISQHGDSAVVRIGVTSSKNFSVFQLPGSSDVIKSRVVVDIKGETTAVPSEKIIKSEEILETKKKTEKDSKKEKQPEFKEEKVAQLKIEYESEKPESSKTKVKPGALAKQLALGVKRIVIDPGHGGNDPGALAQQGIKEKDITLALAKQLAQSLRAKTGCEVHLTRTADKYLHLEERTALANTYKADLFISLHLNSSPAKEAYGIETYFLNLATDESSIAVAARENATSTKNISDLEGILKDLMRNAKIDESSRLAKYVQKNICVRMSRKYSSIKDKGVKQAPFYVLMGAQMPSILIETGFISNSQELKRLSAKDYQSHLCDSIALGVAQYIGSVNPAIPKKTGEKKSSDKKNSSSKKTEKKNNTGKKGKQG